MQDPLIPEGYTYEDFVFESSSSEDEVIVVARDTGNLRPGSGSYHYPLCNIHVKSAWTTPHTL